MFLGTPVVACHRSRWHNIIQYSSSSKNNSSKNNTSGDDGDSDEDGDGDNFIYKDASISQIEY